MDQSSPGAFESFSSGKVVTPVPQPLQHFYKGEPMALGITQILIGLLEIAFGVVLHFTMRHDFYDLQVKTPIWAGILYIISGSLSVAAAKNPKLPLVKGMLGMNIVSTVAAGIVIVISSISMIFQRTSGRGLGDACAYRINDTKVIHACHELLRVPFNTVYNTVSILLMLTIFEFIITIVSSAVVCGSVCRRSYSETTIVIFQNAAEASPLPAP